MQISQPLLKKLGWNFVFIWFLFGGIGHFVFTEFFVGIMPPYVPWHYLAVYVTGVFEIIGAVGLQIPRFRQAAGNGLILLTLAVTPANVHMWMNPELYPDIPEVLLSLRLVIQVGLIVLIYWSTRAPKAQ